MPNDIKAALLYVYAQSFSACIANNKSVATAQHIATKAVEDAKKVVGIL